MPAPVRHHHRKSLDHPQFVLRHRDLEPTQVGLIQELNRSAHPTDELSQYPHTMGSSFAVVPRRTLQVDGPHRSSTRRDLYRLFHFLLRPPSGRLSASPLLN